MAGSKPQKEFLDSGHMVPPFWPQSLVFGDGDEELNTGTFSLPIDRVTPMSSAEKGIVQSDRASLHPFADGRWQGDARQDKLRRKEVSWIS